LPRAGGAPSLLQTVARELLGNAFCRGDIGPTSSLCDAFFQNAQLSGFHSDQA
jgi:hypothetical protein